MADAPERISVTIATGPAACEWVEYIRADLAQIPEDIREWIVRCISATRDYVYDSELPEEDAAITYVAEAWLDSL